MSPFAALTDPLISLIYPQKCGCCHRQVESRFDGAACKNCWEMTRIFNRTETLCSKCGAYLGEKAATAAVRCKKCDDYYFENAFALGFYDRALAATIISLKNSPYLSARVLQLLRERSPDFPNVNLIIPVPLSKERKLERGFNQAEIIAYAISKISGIDIDSKSLVRRLHTQMHRAGMDQKAREQSVLNAFAVTRPKLIEGKSILLVDDVLTSGATASNCAKALKQSGARKVFVFTLARAVTT